MKFQWWTSTYRGTLVYLFWLRDDPHPKSGVQHVLARSIKSYKTLRECLAVIEKIRGLNTHIPIEQIAKGGPSDP